MSSMLYVFKRTIINKIKRALKKPVTYVYIVGIVAYLALVIGAFGSMAVDFGIATPQSFATILSLAVFYLLPADIISYTKRKGLLFRPSEVHMIFPSPAKPKHVLLYAGIKSFIVLFVAAILLVVFGAGYFHLDPWKLILLFLFFGVAENILEGCMIVICYGNETFSDRVMKLFTYILYALMLIITGVAIYMLSVHGIKMSVLTDYLTLPIIQGIPVIGWAIAFVHLIVMGPNMVNIICTICYILSLILLFIYAKKMKCTGEYYEDAMTFADDYETKRKKANKGEAVFLDGKKKHLKSANVEYRGSYAKAIYYRQILEYKKNRFFIFGKNTLLCLGLGIAIAVVAYFSGLAQEAGALKIFIIPGIVAYVLFIFSGYITKWAKELENPYTYLIPDSGIKKLWYSTKIEHIRAFCDGCCVTIPGAIVLGIGPIYALLSILLYMCLNANKLYMTMLSETILGNLLGNTGKTLLRTFIQGLAMVFAIIPAVALGMMINPAAGFMGMIGLTCIITFACAIGAATSFDKMERYE